MQALAVGALAPLAACAPPLSLNATFLQLWRSHLDLTPEDWRVRLSAYRRLGCREIFLQWVGLEGGRPDDWMASDATLRMIFDEAEHQGLGVHVGLPYDQRWWEMLGNANPRALAAYLDHTRTRGVAYMQAAPWPKRRSFRGWYLPYELEQYNWASAARQALLMPWLDALSRAAQDTSRGRPPCISTYHSRLPTDGSLMNLWSAILDQVAVHPMIQDGVGVSGLANYQALAPLHDMLLARRASFDLVLELFEELPSGSTDGSTFKARSADFDRVKQQWEVARGYGAKRVVAFAIDPWVIDNTPEARALMRAWLDARV
ncbi:DUF4434 domain-containing protein [Achromobacter sp. B7]|uniref:DUF4434 domain-containing protein n=1 Tax=Achromobacter sp. B7 TaxID=2282475 RepID=UPI000E76BAF6|nr:DUF4434 domain-containing protein [Achromobacter sp. B7]AYD63646.1 DUF4434 domain-containing protein [Achromobacter sp. B7]